MELVHRVSCLTVGPASPADIEMAAGRVVTEARHHGWWNTDDPEIDLRMQTHPIVSLDPNSGNVTVSVEWKVRVP